MSTVKKAISKALLVSVLAVGMVVAGSSFAANEKADSDKIDYASATIEKLVAVSKQGDPKAQTELGKRYLDQKNYSEAMAWFHKAADQGDASAQFNLALGYESGKGVKQSFADAIKWRRKAAESGHLIAQFLLGASYFQGQGVEQNDVAAEEWFRKAADQGYAPAQFGLGGLWALP